MAWFCKILAEVGEKGREGDGETSNLVQYPSPPFPPQGEGPPWARQKGGLEIPTPLLSPLPICAIASTFPHLAKEEKKNRERGGFSLVANMGWERKVKQKRCLKDKREDAFGFQKKQKYQLCDLDGGDGGGQKYFFSKNICFASYSFLLSTKHFRALHPWQNKEQDLDIITHFPAF